ncbi:hypothetical protein JOD45_001877 [Scopulibacillus daqui]|uniref:Knr4/Smi1-like domain-containing protein n=1 Tax=Scopulibacillus daqui TaxID=1469162 RepID=A0ABS2Q029_9BACL|nr:SMI1/KNR4 family protein [Scopulibacillus daqui]MBM7645659.1 hypothetical protein [Scopulibacillus daqui]
MSKEKIIKIIKDNKDIDAGDFTDGVDENTVKNLENELKVTLPESYKWFLLNYGSGGLYGVDILGVGLVGVKQINQASVVKVTKEYRDVDLDKDLVIIEDCGEYMYCLDTSQMQNAECPVVSWDQMGGIGIVIANNFYDFLYDRLSNGKEAWEEDI